MGQSRCRMPKVLVPYPGPCTDEGIQDVFVYLRPESNGVDVESTILKAIRANPLYDKGNDLVYLANLPGDFIVERRVVEQHYAVKLHFAVRGASAFTPKMKETFEAFFQISFDQARIVGGFEALKILDLDPEELFNLWVSPFDMLVINGQTIKRKDDIFIVNYNIPALLHKNSRNTDIAVMVFRSSLTWVQIHRMMDDMGQALIEKKIMDPLKPASRFFHYSKGPFEQILDGSGYLYDPSSHSIPLEDISFARYLFDHGYSRETIRHLIRNPIFVLSREDGTEQEDNILDFSAADSYQGAMKELQSCKAQIYLR